MGPPYSLRIPRVRRYSGFQTLSLDFVYETITLFGYTSHCIRLSLEMLVLVRTPSVLLLLVWPLSRSLATTSEISVDFSSSGYLDVSVPQVPLINLCIQLMIYGSSPYVFPHSEIHGSRLICSSPWLIAACHVFHRLLMPRHSPYALVCLNFFRLLSPLVLYFSRIAELLKNSFCF